MTPFSNMFVPSNIDRKRKKKVESATVMEIITTMQF